jgi:hypothetical protein
MAHSLDSPTPPRFLRFVTALVLGTAVGAIPATLAGCDEGGDDPPPVDARVDAPTDGMPDMGVVVDGPLPPPDLPRLV